MLRNVAAVLLDGVNPFELGVVCEVFGIDRSDDGLPVYDFAVVSAQGPSVRTSTGFTLGTEHGLKRLETADLITVPAGASYASREFPPEMLDALRRAVDRGARVLSVCSGVFVLAAAGLLEGRRAAVHWKHAQELSRRYPHLTVEPDVLYVDEDPVITSAGTAAGIDACLHLVRKEQGPEVANRIARRMVVPPHRDGGQAQYIERPLPEPGATRSPGCWCGWSSTSTRRSPSSSSPPAPTCRRAPSPAASSRRPAPRRTAGSCASGCCWPSICWSGRTRRSTRSRAARASATRPRCATTSCARWGPPRSPTGAFRGPEAA